jgi:predicted RNA-binding Zn-ribbon protein involved in translation (DUF1610 family)
VKRAADDEIIRLAMRWFSIPEPLGRSLATWFPAVASQPQRRRLSVLNYPRQRSGMLQDALAVGLIGKRVGRGAMKKRKKKGRASSDDASYVCPTCGENIVIPVDRSAGQKQQYIEDCPVCCNPNVIHVDFLIDEELPRVWAEAE